MKPLVIFEMANNHMGEVAHGQAVIEAFANAVASYRDDFEFGFKLQYRDLESFIHPMAKGRADIKYVRRFEETRLSDAEFRLLVETMRAHGFTTVCTPFDEASVQRIADHGIDVIKIASCAFTDWPLLERIALSDRPVIASTAAAAVEDIDAVVSFFSHRDRPLSLLHCVGEYPTSDDHLAINQIEVLRNRYPAVPIGLSSHEDPERTETIMLALAKGASILEKHVGLATERHTLNAYSASPQQIARWLEAGRRALRMLGPARRYQPSESEVDGLRSLKRGVFARHALPAGKVLTADDVYFAFPPQPGQLTASDWSKYTLCTLGTPLEADAPVAAVDVEMVFLRQLVMDAVTAARQLLKAGNVILPGRSELEISHHYGLEQFHRFGLTMITVVNRAYCKKVLVLLPGQTHPEQYHKIKEETFVVLHGTMTIHLDGQARTAGPGDVVTVERGVRHAFHTEGGVVFEEISSTHIADDSYYSDPAIGANRQRKTLLTYWM